MTLTEIKAAHDLIHPTLRKWSGVTEACHRWLDGYRDEQLLYWEMLLKKIVLDTLVHMTSSSLLIGMLKSSSGILAILLPDILRTL